MIILVYVYLSVFVIVVVFSYFLSRGYTYRQLQKKPDTYFLNLEHNHPCCFKSCMLFLSRSSIYLERERIWKTYRKRLRKLNKRDK